MIPIEVLLAFLAASALITVAPGPDNLMVLSVGISRGRAAGVGFGLGCALGCFTHTLWATLGIGALVLEDLRRATKVIARTLNDLLN